jgi:N-acetylglucosamine-6-phosphate deacetylase
MNDPTALLRNARIVLPERVVERANLVVEGGRIAGIVDSTAGDALPGESVLDGAGYTVFPGFIDIHIHGAVGVDTTEATTAELHRVGEFLSRCGVTSWLPTLVPVAEAQYESAVRAIQAVISGGEEKRQAGSLRSRALGVHYEGPFVSDRQCGALHREFFRTFNHSSDLDKLPTIDDDSAIHLMTVAPEIDGGVELVRELTRRGWIVSIGHTRAGIDVLDRAFEAGARHMTHFMNAMTALHHRAPGPVGWGLDRDDVTCDFIADGIHLDQFMLKLLLKLKGPERLSLISDAIAATGLGDGQYRIWDETIAVENGRTRNEHGAIAGSVITMLDGVRMMRSLGVPEPQVARMASFNPARLLGIDRDCGSIEEGKRADLVVLDEKSQVVLTLIGGRLAFGAWK